MARRSTKPRKAAKEKKQTPAKVAEVHSNLTDDTIREVLTRATTLQRDVMLARAASKSASGFLREHVKHGEKLGVEGWLTRWWLETQVRDVEDVDRETRKKSRAAKAMNFPLQAQLGFMDDQGTTVASAIDEAQIVTQADLDAAYQAGFAAHREGRGWDSSGYALDDPRRPSWTRGWDDSERVAADGIQPLPAAEPEAAVVEQHEEAEALFG